MSIWPFSNSYSLLTVMGNFLNPDTEQPPQSFPLNLFAWLQHRFSLSPSSKIHDYRRYQSGIDYFLDVTHSADTAMITGEGRGIKPHDSFLISIDNQVCQYQVTELDYYSHSSDIWIASLKYLGVDRPASSLTNFSS